MNVKTIFTAAVILLATPLAGPGESRITEKHIEAVREAIDPSSALTGYVEGLIADPHSIKLRKAYVRRMVEFGLAESAFEQARTLVEVNEKDGLSWAVVAFGEASRGHMPDSVNAIDQALKHTPKNEFVLHTAGQLVGWYDARNDPSAVPDDTRIRLEAIRDKFGETDAFKVGYKAAMDELTAAQTQPDSESTYDTTRYEQSGYPWELFVYYHYYPSYRHYYHYYPYYSLFHHRFRNRGNHRFKDRSGHLISLFFRLRPRRKLRDGYRSSDNPRPRRQRSFRKRRRSAKSSLRLRSDSTHPSQSDRRSPTSRGRTSTAPPRVRRNTGQATSSKRDDRGGTTQGRISKRSPTSVRPRPWSPRRIETPRPAVKPRNPKRPSPNIARNRPRAPVSRKKRISRIFEKRLRTPTPGIVRRIRRTPGASRLAGSPGKTSRASPRGAVRTSRTRAGRIQTALTPSRRSGNTGIGTVRGSRGRSHRGSSPRGLRD